MIVQTLKETEQFDNTIIIITADHGEMLGERGLWYKMNFFEPSGRVPMIMAGPGIVNRKVKSICSLVDVLPTLIDIGVQGGMEEPELVQSIDGRSLLPMATGDFEDGGEAIGEYCAELTPSPVFMIRRGDYKFICSEGDPPLLYNLEDDPDELDNLVGEKEFASILGEFEREAANRWDIDKIKADVIAKQKQRHTLFKALEKERLPIGITIHLGMPVLNMSEPTWIGNSQRKEPGYHHIGRIPEIILESGSLESLVCGLGLIVQLIPRYWLRVILLNNH